MKEPTKMLASSSERNSVIYSSLGQEHYTLTRSFSNLCDRLITSILQKKTIHERTLLDFSRIAIIIVNTDMDRPTENFQNLERLISDYWRYGLKNETNQLRGYSYIRLYQMVELIQTFHRDRKLERRVHAEIDKNYDNAELVMKIRISPGITRKRLMADLSTTSGEFQDKLQVLEKDGFLLSRRSGDDQYYLLTEAGDVLHRHLTSTGNKKWIDQWSDERIFVLAFLLRCLKARGERMLLVQEVGNQVASLNESEVIRLYWAVKNNPKDSSYSDQRLFTRDTGIFTEKKVMEKQSKPLIFEEVSSEKGEELLIYERCT